MAWSMASLAKVRPPWRGSRSSGEASKNPKGRTAQSSKASLSFSRGVGRAHALRISSSVRSVKALQDGFEDLFLVAEHQVQRRPGDACGVGEVAHGGPPVAVAEEYGFGGLEDPGFLFASHEKSVDIFVRLSILDVLTLLVTMSIQHEPRHDSRNLTWAQVPDQAGRVAWSPAPIPAPGSRRPRCWPAAGLPSSWAAGTWARLRMPYTSSGRNAPRPRWRSSPWSWGPWPPSTLRPRLSRRASPPGSPDQQRRGDDPPLGKTEDGFETQLGTNHLGHFALTGLLLDRLMETPGSRIVTMSSNAHHLGRIRFEDLHFEQGYRAWAAYGQSKLANLMFTYELQRRLAGPRVHPRGGGPPRLGENGTPALCDPELDEQSVAFPLLGVFFCHSAARVRCRCSEPPWTPPCRGVRYYGPPASWSSPGLPRGSARTVGPGTRPSSAVMAGLRGLTGVAYPLSHETSPCRQPLHGHPPRGLVAPRLDRTTEYPHGTLTPRGSTAASTTPSPSGTNFAGALASILSPNPNGIPKAPSRSCLPPATGSRAWHRPAGHWLGHSTTAGGRRHRDPHRPGLGRPRLAPWLAGPRRFFAPPMPLATCPCPRPWSSPTTTTTTSTTTFADEDWDTALRRAPGRGRAASALGRADGRIIELDWWERRAGGRPSRHLHAGAPRLGPGLRQGPDAVGGLCASWGPSTASSSPATRGMFPGLRDIGEHLGPFDLTMIEAGAYDQAWPDWHLGPEQAVEAHRMVRGRVLRPSTGAFRPGAHGWTEPVERVLAAAARASPWLVPRPGEPFEPGTSPPLSAGGPPALEDRGEVPILRHAGRPAPAQNEERHEGHPLRGHGHDRPGRPAGMPAGSPRGARARHRPQPAGHTHAKLREYPHRTSWTSPRSRPTCRL